MRYLILLLIHIAVCAEDATERVLYSESVGNCKITVISKYMEYLIKDGRVKFQNTTFTIFDDKFAKDKLSRLLDFKLEAVNHEYNLLAMIDDGVKPYIVVLLDATSKETLRLSGFDKMADVKFPIVLDVKKDNDCVYVLYQNMLGTKLCLEALVPNLERPGCGGVIGSAIIENLNFWAPERATIVLMKEQGNFLLLTRKSANDIRLYSFQRDDTSITFKALSRANLDEIKKR